MFKNIVVALDRSACSAHAYELALALAGAQGAKITICSVVDPMSAMWKTSSDPTPELALANAENAANSVVTEAVARARGAGLDVEGKVRSGDPAEEIVACAVATNADAIVTGTHGFTGIKHFVMGSVAEAVLRTAPCPVVVVRGEARIPAIEEAVL